MQQLSCNHTKNVSYNRTVVLICHCFDMQLSISLSVMDCDSCLELQLTHHISIPSLTLKIDISKSTAVIRYVEGPYMTYIFEL